MFARPKTKNNGAKTENNEVLSSPFGLSLEIEFSLIKLLDSKSLTQLSVTCKYFSWLKDYLEQYLQFQKLELLNRKIPAYLESLQSMQQQEILSVNFRLQHCSKDTKTVFEKTCYYFADFYTDYDNLKVEENKVIEMIDRVYALLPFVQIGKDELSRSLHYLLSGVLDVLEENEKHGDKIEYKNLRKKSLVLFEKLLQKGADPNYFVESLNCLNVIAYHFFFDKRCEFIKLLLKYDGNPYVIGRHADARKDNFFPMMKILDMEILSEWPKKYHDYMHQLNITYCKVVEVEYERIKLEKSNQRLISFNEKLTFYYSKKRQIEKDQKQIEPPEKKRRNSM